MRRHKIPLEKVQEAFNDAVKRRDMRCMIRDYEPCCGQLECSHYYTVGSSPSLRFYPPNAYAQCQKHHWNHHNKKEWADAYEDWLRRNHLEELEAMEGLRHRFIKYDDELKAEIIRLCNADKLDELTRLIEENLK
ncbi:MAG: recombination protein NinG [Treponema sp.]|nr:recombination protein NinG [Treponema sp.]